MSTSSERNSDGGLRSLLVVGSAYLVQGLIAAVGLLLHAHLAAIGTPLETQAKLLASGAIPWVLKFVLAVVLDLAPSWTLRMRAAALTALQLSAAACVWVVAQAWVQGPDGALTSLLPLILAWFALNLCAAGQDVVVDALALDTLATRRAAAATAMGVGMALGFYVLGTWVLGGRITNAGMSVALRSPAGWIAGIALVPILALWQRSSSRPAKAREQAEGRAWRMQELARLLWIPPLFVALTFAVSATSTLGPDFLFQHLAWDWSSYATLLLPIASLTALLGSFASGPIIAKLGPVRATLITSALLGSVWLGFAATHSLWSQQPVIMLLSAWEGIAQAAMMVALHALALFVAARTPLPTTAFVLAMAALNLPRVLAPLLAPQLLELGWVLMFVVCGLGQLLVSAGVWPLKQRAG